MDTGVTQTLCLAIFGAKNNEILAQTPDLHGLIHDFFGSRHRIPEINIHL